MRNQLRVYRLRLKKRQVKATVTGHLTKESKWIQAFTDRRSLRFFLTNESLTKHIRKKSGKLNP